MSTTWLSSVHGVSEQDREAYSSPLRVGRHTFDEAVLHPSVFDPSIAAASFLNEATLRFPDAISFASGAPHPSPTNRFEIRQYLDAYGEYLAHHRGFSYSDIQRHLHQYGPSKGLINELIASALKLDEDIEVTPEAIVVTVGCQEALLLTFRALHSTPGDILVVVVPCYVGAIGAARILDFEISTIDQDDGASLTGQLKQVCAAARAAGKQVKAVYVAPDHANPSGVTMSMNARNELLQLSGDEDFIIVEDTTYSFTSGEKESMPLLKRLDEKNRVIMLGTFAKTCIPGARVGFAVADQVITSAIGRPPCLLADKLASLKTMVTINTPPICQAIIGGIIVMHGGSIKAFSRSRSALYKRNMECLLNALDRYFGSNKTVTWNRPSGGFFVRLSVPVKMDKALVMVSAERFGVLWTPMCCFYPDGRESRELRLSCSYLSQDQINEGVRRLSAFVHYIVGVD